MTVWNRDAALKGPGHRRGRSSPVLTASVALASAVALVATTSSTVVEAAPRPIKIGVIFPLSGPLGQGGIDNLNGVKIAVQEANASGGIAGSQVVLAVENGPDPATAASDATQLITADHVQEIIGTVDSDLALAAAPVANRDHVIYWEVEAVANNLTQMGFKYLFRVPPDSYVLGSTSAQYAVGTVAAKLGISPKKLRVGVITVTGAYGVDTTSGVVGELKTYGIRPVANVSYDPASTNLDSVVLKLKSAKPDIIIATEYSTDAVLFTNEALQLGLHYRALVGTAAGQTPIEFEQGLGGKANGIISDSFAFDVPKSSLSAAAAAQNLRFDADFAKAYRHQPDVGAYLAYVGTVDLLKVMQKAGGAAPAAVRTAALAINEPLGSSVNGWGLHFTSDGQNTLDPLTIVQWQHEELKIIAPPKFATGILDPSIMAH